MAVQVSIICPIRNEARHIAACLESLLDQTYDSSQIEILVVDGMSDDGTRDIVLEFTRKHTSIRLLDNPNRIVPSALNIGITESEGAFLLRMDGHAKAANDYVESCVNALHQNGADGVGGPIITVNDSDTGMAISLAMSSSFGVGNSRFRTSQNKECYVDTLAFTAYRREVFDKNGLFDEELVRCQDDEFNFRIRKQGGKILLTPTIKSWYFPRQGFIKLWRQYFGYGYWKVRILQKHFWMMQPRHFVPALFVATLVALLLTAPFIKLSAYLFSTLAALYLIISIWAAFYTRRKNPTATVLKILFSFYILHFSYGSGFLWGLIKFAPRWSTNKMSALQV